MCSQYKVSRRDMFQNNSTMTVNMFSLIKISFRRSFKNYISYKFNALGEVIFSFTSIIFIFFISETFSNSESGYLEKYGNDYFMFLFTGVSVLFFITRTFSSMISFAMESQTLGYIESIINTRTSFTKLLSAYVFFPIAQATLRLFLLYLFSVIFAGNQLNFFSFILMVFVLIFSTIPFFGLGLIFVGLIIIFKRAAFLYSIFLLGCSIFSGIFYPIEVMPQYLSYLSLFFPSTFSVELIRSMFMEQSLFTDQIEIIIFIIFLSILYFLIGRYFLNFSIRYAKEKGTLIHY